MIRIFSLSIFLLIASCRFIKEEKLVETEKINQEAKNIKFKYQDVSGIGKDSLHNRRDNSDVIKVGDTYYVWYSKMDSPETAGYWATIWYATSQDEGRSWTEQGMALDVGERGEFDSHSVFTPNILAYEGKYYLYYTGVQPTPGNAQNEFENNSVNDFTAIGLAVADRPEGPFVRSENNPVLEVSEDPNAFDSYRIDDASLLVRDRKIWLYYKGRSLSHGKKGPGLTEMGVAFGDNPEGPFEKHKGSLLDKSHEVLIWKKDTGVASLASISKTVNYANDGLLFSTIVDSLTNIPKAPGLYRPDLEDGNMGSQFPGWGIAMKSRKGQTYLVRYEME